MTAFPPVPRVSGVAASLLRANVDTDAIIPSREIKGVGKTGLSDGLFAGWRYRGSGRDPDPGFVLNDPRFAHAPILLAGANFGCGSSREHAVWALHEYGVRAVVAPGFAPIFFANCVRNGIVPVVLPEPVVADLAAAGGCVMIDVVARQVTADGRTYDFSLDEQAGMMLAEGLDAIELTMKHAATIATFHARDRASRPWIYL